MGNKPEKLLNMNKERREKYDEAYKILGDRLFKIPVKYIVSNLEENNWKGLHILYVLLYLRQYTQIFENKPYRILELNEWIDGLKYVVIREFDKGNEKQFVY